MESSDKQEVIAFLKSAIETEDSKTFSQIIDRAQFSSRSLLMFLLYSISEDKMKIATSLLQRGVDPRAFNPEKTFTCLHLACFQGSFSLFQELFRRSSFEDVLDCDGNGLLMYACREGTIEKVKFLFEIGITLASPSSSTCQLQNIISRKTSLEVVKYLVDQGIPLNNEIDGVNPLDRALHKNRQDIADYLYRAGASFRLHPPKEKGNHLHRALLKRNKEALRFLLQVIDKDELNRPGIQGITIWRTAFGYPDPEIITMLLDFGADVNYHFDCDNSFPLVLSVNHPEVLEILLQKRADLYQKSNFGSNVLHVAAREGNIASVKLLLHQGIDVDIKDERGRTPLHYSVGGKHFDLFHFLLEAGAKMELPPM